MTFSNFYWIFFLYTLVISLFFHRFFVIRAERYKIKKVNTSAERWSSQTKPILGGITFFAMFLFAILNYGAAFGLENLLQGPIFGIVIVITLSFLMGLADDMLNTPPSFKFIIQIGSAVILIYSGIYIHIFAVPMYNYLLTVFWVVGIMNSINMLDNMDAITTSVSSTILLATSLILAIKQPFSGALFIISLGGLASLLSFLYYNWSPAKMYMGDNGSQFLGSLLAILGIIVFWNAPNTTSHSVLYPFMVAFLAFLVPISDTTTVTINRILRGQSPFVGGRDHTTHHLSYLGLSERKVAGILLTINLISVSVAAFIILYPEKFIVPLLIVGLCAFAVLVTLYTITKISKPAK